MSSPSHPSHESDIIGGSTNASYASPHRRRGQTRREALNRILKHRASSRPNQPGIEGSSKMSSPERQKRQQEESAPLREQHEPLDNPKHHSELSNRLMNSSANGKLKNDGGGGNTVTTAASTVSLQSTVAGYSALPDDHSDKTPVKRQVTDDSGDASSSSSQLDAMQTKRKPQHLETHDEEEMETRYYRITYQGVVALLSEPHRTAPKSGAYVSYGEVIMSRHEVNIDEAEESTLDSNISVGISPKPSMASDLYASPESPPQSVLTNAGSVSSLDTLRTTSTAAPSHITQSKSQAMAAATTKRLVRVDKVLTGGYAIDASEDESIAEQPPSSRSPERSNLQYVPMVGPSPLPLTNSPSADDSETKYGYLFTRKRNAIIAERMSAPPLLQTGTFLVKIVSSAPVAILTGPRVDAPRTRAMLLPGTVHEVCLKMTTDETDVSFLRLSHRRGWITDRRVTALGGIIKIGVVPAVKDVTDTIGEADDTTVSAVSLASASFTSTGSSVRKRHRPPRRKREAAAATTNEKSGFPRHVGGQVGLQNQTTPTKSAASSTATTQMNLSPGRVHEKLDGTPSSNVSILSDDESFDLGSQYRFPGGLTPDRSVSSARRQQLNQEASTFFLMRVNAPRGLKILDAPHFQVSSLIHGKNDSTGQNNAQLSGAQSSAAKGSGSIFQTMSTHHTTKVKVASQIGNPAIFDSIKKTRILPRGVVFEASKRMEASGAFNRGAGLIKLSDNSGWAIVPKSEELDAQYRNYHGGAINVKESGITRAFDEVGNAEVDFEDYTNAPSAPPIWIRVTAKSGVSVACPPPVAPVSKDDDESPTSSAGDSSILSGGGSNYGALSGSGSDVASSVGSAFLDAMFRTPKKRPSHGIENRTVQETFGHRRGRRPLSQELQDVPSILPCGSCVQVERWEDTSDALPVKTGRCQDYVRLRGGQGWIPLNLGGKTVAAVIETPDIRLGSFWFRVTSLRGIKVRLGPSRKAGSIKFDDGVHFRFECGEFLRASEVVTFFHNQEPVESFAKLYRNRHVRLNDADESDVRQLLSMTTPAEWVQIHSDGRLFLEECGAEPQILRHREGWRYNVVADSGVTVRIGPSFDAEATGVRLLAGESVVITERMTAPGEESAWLRLKDGDGWVCDSDRHGRPAMIAHSLRHRTTIGGGAPQKAARSEHEEVAYNSIVARLFHEGVPGRNEGIPHEK